MKRFMVFFVLSFGIVAMGMDREINTSERTGQSTSTAIERIEGRVVEAPEVTQARIKAEEATNLYNEESLYPSDKRDKLHRLMIEAQVEYGATLLAQISKKAEGQATSTAIERIEGRVVEAPEVTQARIKAEKATNLYDKESPYPSKKRGKLHALMLKAQGEYGAMQLAQISKKAEGQAIFTATTVAQNQEILLTIVRDALAAENEELALELLERGRNVITPERLNIFFGPNDRTLLMAAAEKGLLKVVQKLLDLGADPEVTQPQGSVTAWHLADMLSEWEEVSFEDQARYKQIMGILKQPPQSDSEKGESEEYVVSWGITKVISKND